MKNYSLDESKVKYNRIKAGISHLGTRYIGNENAHRAIKSWLKI